MRTGVLLAIISTSILTLSCTERQRIPSAFVGVWQSDEALTLASLEKSTSVSATDLEAFTNDFFGDRVMVYKATEYTAYWVGDQWADIEQEEYWLPYDFVDSGPDFVIIRYPANEVSAVEEKTWHLEGDLIYVELPQWGFREYYRRTGD